jgi:hypothetical protein
MPGEMERIDSTRVDEITIYHSNGEENKFNHNTGEYITVNQSR